MQQLEIAPMSDSLNVSMELLGIKVNSLYMPLLNGTRKSMGMKPG